MKRLAAVLLAASAPETAVLQNGSLIAVSLFASNVLFWLERRGINADDETVDRIFSKAKASPSVLSEDDIRALLAK